MNNLPFGNLSNWFLTDYYLVLFGIIIYTQYKPDEVDTFAKAFRDISAKLAAAAESIDAASADADD